MAHFDMHKCRIITDESLFLMNINEGWGGVYEPLGYCIITDDSSLSIYH